jgi:hypothetical protein
MPTDCAQGITPGINVSLYRARIIPSAILNTAKKPSTHAVPGFSGIWAQGESTTIAGSNRINKAPVWLASLMTFLVQHEVLHYRPRRKGRVP